MSKAPNAPQHIIDLLEEGLQMTRMKTAGFTPNEHGMQGADEFTEKVRERTRVYRETWVEQPLAVVLAYLKGDIDVAEAKWLWTGDNRVRDEDISNPLVLLGLDKRVSQ